MATQVATPWFILGCDGEQISGRHQIIKTKMNRTNFTRGDEEACSEMTVTNFMKLLEGKDGGQHGVVQRVNLGANSVTQPWVDRKKIFSAEGA